MLCFVLYHTQRCSGLIPGSALLRDHYWCIQGMPRIKLVSATCKTRSCQHINPPAPWLSVSSQKSTSQLFWNFTLILANRRFPSLCGVKSSILFSLYHHLLLFITTSRLLLLLYFTTCFLLVSKWKIYLYFFSIL